MLKAIIGFFAVILVKKSLSLTIAEPRCSKFDYEEKLLAKMIRMELEMERLKLEMESNIKPKLENLELAVVPSTPMVAFSAYNIAKTEYSEDQIIVFKSVFFNDCSSYDTLTGVFKAPIKGLYFFNLHVCNKHKSPSHVAIVHKDKKIAISVQYEDAGTSCGSVSSLIKVDVGDNIYVVSAYSTKMYENTHRRASFMGFLVHT